MALAQHTVRKNQQCQQCLYFTYTPSIQFFFQHRALNYSVLKGLEILTIFLQLKQLPCLLPGQISAGCQKQSTPADITPPGQLPTGHHTKTGRTLTLSLWAVNSPLSCPFPLELQSPALVSADDPAVWMHWCCHKVQGFRSPCFRGLPEEHLSWTQGSFFFFLFWW